MGCRGLPGCSIIRASLTVALMVSLPRCGSLWAFGPSAHRAHASLRACRGLGQRPKPCAAAQKSERCECPKGTRNAPRSNTLLSCMTHKRRGHPLPGGAAPLLFKKHYQLSLERPAFLAPLRSLATLDGLCRRKRWRPPASSCIKPRFSRPFGRSQRSTGFAAGNAAVLPRLPASSRVSCSLRSLATLTAFAAAEVFGALPQTPARA